MRPEPAAARADGEYCRRAIQAGSNSFYTASMLLPKRIRGPSYALYAFCRLADDAVDDGPSDARTIERLERRLAKVYAGAPLNSPVDRAFTRIVERFEIPRLVPDALIDGLRWDCEGRVYGDLRALLDYSARVASTVGVMMTLIMGRRSQPVLTHACELGLAMQLTNIARDVGEDARNGRLYLPRMWLEEAGLDPDRWLAEPHSCTAIRHCTARILMVAGGFYRTAERGINGLPWNCRPAIQAARLIYAEIGREVTRSGFDPIGARAFVNHRRKLALLAKSWTSVPFIDRLNRHCRPDPSVQFLVAWSDQRTIEPEREAKFNGRIDRTIGIIGNLRAREHALRARRRRLDDVSHLAGGSTLTIDQEEVLS